MNTQQGPTQKKRKEQKMLPQLECWLTSETQSYRYQVEQRVVGQLLQTLLYEDVITYQVVQDEVSGTRFIAQGMTADGKVVEYRCYGLKSQSFDLIRLNFSTLERVAENHIVEPVKLHKALDELLYSAKKSPYLPRFINEIEQTFIKDVQSRSQNYQTNIASHLLSAEALEQHFMDAHSYHPCYKSRIGFSLTENTLYGSEFGSPIQIIWLAMRKSISQFKVSTQLDINAFLQQECGEKHWQQFSDQLNQFNEKSEDYWCIPVHPWQWEHVIMPSFANELLTNELIYLGHSEDDYQAQQSLRTLQNITDVTRPYVKFSLSITNTSSTRILAKHTVLNGPIITDWLYELISTDEIAKTLDFVILREIAGVSFDQDSLPDLRKPQTYGALGTIWRESIHKYLKEGESAVPFNGLSHLENQYRTKTVEPFIAPWIEQYGLESWTKQLLKVTVPPIINMLYAEGIGMESHGQNIILITRDGWPQRIALKDFHDGVRYSPKHLSRPELAPTLTEMPAEHAKLNSNSFIITDDVNAVRDFSCDCFFFICLSDLAIFLTQNYQLPEVFFWEQVAAVIHEYQRQYPQHSQRFKLFDLFAPYYEVEELTKRRLLGDDNPRIKQVPNPLYPFGTSAC